MERRGGSLEGNLGGGDSKKKALGEKKGARGGTGTIPFSRNHVGEGGRGYESCEGISQSSAPLTAEGGREVVREGRIFS